jgi:phosphatidylinositol alpha-mannosyltransferase
MAVGKPIIASNVEGYARIITHGAEGWLVPPKDEQALAQSLIALLKDEPLRQEMGAKGRLKAQDYAWENVAQRVMDYYTKVLSESPGKERSSKPGAVLV